MIFISFHCQPISLSIAQPKRLMLWTLVYFWEQTNKNLTVKNWLTRFGASLAVLLFAHHIQTLYAMIGFTLVKAKIPLLSRKLHHKEWNNINAKILRNVIYLFIWRAWKRTTNSIQNGQFPLDTSYTALYIVSIEKLMPNNQGQQRNHEPTNNNRRMKMPHSREWNMAQW